MTLIKNDQGLLLSIDQINTLIFPTKNSIQVYSHFDSFCFLIEESLNVFSDLEKNYYSYCKKKITKLLKTKEIFKKFISPEKVIIGDTTVNLYTGELKKETTILEYSQLGLLLIEKPLKISTNLKILYEDNSIVDFFYLLYKDKIFLVLKNDLLLLDLTKKTIEKRAIKVSQIYYAGMIFIENSTGIYRVEEVL